MSARSPPGQWRRLSPDVVVGDIDAMISPGRHEQVETYHCLGITDTPCLVDVDGVAAGYTGPDVVRRHSPGDRIQVTLGAHVRSHWLLVSASVLDRSSAPFGRLPLPVLAAVRRGLHKVASSHDAMEAEEAAFELFALVDTASPTPQTPPDSRSARLVAAANEALIAGYAEPLRVAGIAHELGVSPSYLARIYRTHEGSPLHQRLTRLRVAAALARLNAGEPNLTKLALDVGFSSHSHFTSAFKRLVGACPKDYRLASQI